MVAKREGQNSFEATLDCDFYEIRPRKSGDGVDLINERFRYGPIWYVGPDAVRNAVAYAKYRSLSRSHGAKIHVFDDSGAGIQTHESYLATGRRPAESGARNFLWGIRR